MYTVYVYILRKKKRAIRSWDNMNESTKKLYIFMQEIHIAVIISMLLEQLI